MSRDLGTRSFNTIACKICTTQVDRRMYIKHLAEHQWNEQVEAQSKVEEV